MKIQINIASFFFFFSVYQPFLFVLMGVAWVQKVMLGTKKNVITILQHS